MLFRSFRAENLAGTIFIFLNAKPAGLILNSIYSLGTPSDSVSVASAFNLPRRAVSFRAHRTNLLTCPLTKHALTPCPLTPPERFELRFGRCELRISSLERLGSLLEPILRHLKLPLKLFSCRIRRFTPRRKLIDLLVNLPVHLLVQMPVNLQAPLEHAELIAELVGPCTRSICVRISASICEAASRLSASEMYISADHTEWKTASSASSDSRSSP